MAREAIKPEIRQALETLARFDSGQARVQVLEIRPGPLGSEPFTVPNGGAPYFEVSPDQLKDIDGWLLQHPLLGGARNYRLRVWAPKKDGTYSQRHDRQFEFNFASPTDTALGAMAQNPAMAGAAAAGANEMMQFYSGKATEAADLARTKSEEAASLAETDPKRAKDLAQQAEAAARDAKQFSDSAGQQMNVLGQVLANMQRTNAQQTPLGQTQGQPPGYGAPNWQFYQPPPGYPPPGYPPPGAFGYPPGYGPPPFGYPPPAAPAPADNGMMVMLTKLIDRLDRDPPKAPGPSPELVAMQAQMQAMQQSLAEARAATEQARRDSEHARELAVRDAQMAELRAEMRRFADGDRGKPDTALEIAKIQLAQASQTADRDRLVQESIRAMSEKHTDKMMELLQAGGNDDYAEQAKKLIQAQGEIFQNGMQMVQMMSKIGGGESSGKEPAWAPYARAFIGQITQLGNGLMTNPQNAQATLQQAQQQAYQQQAQQLPPPPQFPQAPQGVPLPQQQAQQQMPGVPLPQQIPAGAQAQQVPQPPGQPAPAQPQAPAPGSPEALVEQARAQLRADDVLGAFTTIKAAMAQHPGLRAQGEDDLAAAQRYFDGYWPAIASKEQADALEGRVVEAAVALYGAGILGRLAELAGQTQPAQPAPTVQPPNTPPPAVPVPPPTGAPYLRPVP